MILNFIRAVLILLLLFVIIVDFDLPIIINTKTNQLFIAILILLIILLVDEIIGFLIGLIFLIIYFKYYQKKIMPIKQENQTNSPITYEQSNNNNNNNNDPITSLFNFFSGDVKPKSYSNQPEIPEHYINHIKNDNSTIMPYVSNELLKAAQNNIYNDDNYKTEIKTSENYYGIQGLNSDNKHYAAFDNNYKNFNNL
uniref:Uncharacterized protein n=1 Tax=viral metagenome TaxID=1070528 RepID=A0A6C0EQ74_9ZZZZ